MEVQASIWKSNQLQKGRPTLLHLGMIRKIFNLAGQNDAPLGGAGSGTFSTAIAYAMKAIE
jgi:hypothetical protein